MIKPQKLFFMAIDGVAPRAKMNQQRGRRFRSAKDAEKSEVKAKEKGEILPDQDRFDSNCITPGTVFMAKLHEQLKYFIVNKISTDALWQQCKIILSGHETPGEGEHKIMDYIRYMRAQPGYDPNTRHCLFGLDADLMMLGLCTHERHFALLREEVKFGKKSTKKILVPEEITFYLLHLSLMREYLELEFLPLKGRLSFEYDLEKIIDDWVLMGFLVGNDFIPHLPDLHIADGALPILYNTYMNVLPDLNGYINENGILNLERFQQFMEALSKVDLEHFSEYYSDLKYLEAKRANNLKDIKVDSKYMIDKFLDSCLEEQQDSMPKKFRDSGLEALIKATDDILLEENKKQRDCNLDDILKEEDVVIEEEYDFDDAISEEKSKSSYEDVNFKEEFRLHKRDYYMNKLEYEQITPEIMKSQAEGYIKAIQWNLHYYYNGVCSWSWFYPHHYAPYISDIKDFKDIKFDFELGKPFKPYEQLLAVLPAASKKLLPKCYHHLMLSEESDIKSYYPEDFKTDLNGKKHEWEAVVLIPFIDEEKLLKAMEPCNNLLTPDEIKRNTHGPMLIYNYSKTPLGDYPAPDYFPTVKNHHANCISVTIDDIRVPRDKLIKGAYPGVTMDIYYPGFSTFKHLKYEGKLEKAKVKVHQLPSKLESMIVKIIKEDQNLSLDEVASKLIGKVVFVGWPHLVEALVISVSNKHNKIGDEGNFAIGSSKDDYDLCWWNTSIVNYYYQRLGIEVGEVEILVHVKLMTGRKYLFSPNGRINLEKQWSSMPASYPLQTILTDINVYEKEYVMYRDVNCVFPKGSLCYMLGQPCYGMSGEVLDSEESLKKGRVKVRIKEEQDPDFSQIYLFEKELQTRYMPVYTAASYLSISKILFSRITGAVLIVIANKEEVRSSDDMSKTNIGLNLKYNKKNEEIPGYTKKQNGIWLYSEKTVALVNSYMEYCPELFEMLNTNVNKDYYYCDELYPDGDGKEKIKEIVSWLEKQPVNSIERQTCGTLILESDVVKKIEETIEDNKTNKICKHYTMQIKPHLLFKPELQIGNVVPDPSVEFCLYDRVVNIRQSYTVPFGFVGTIIGIHGNEDNSKLMIDIVFDDPFAGGFSLNCSSGKGYRLPSSALINRSYGKRELQKRTGKPGKLIQKFQGQPLFQWHNQERNYSMNNGQYQNSSPYYQQQQQNSAFATWNNSPSNIPPLLRQGGFQQNPSFPPPNIYYNHSNSFGFSNSQQGQVPFKPPHEQFRSNQESFRQSTDNYRYQRDAFRQQEIFKQDEPYKQRELNRQQEPQKQGEFSRQEPKKQDLSFKGRNDFYPFENKPKKENKNQENKNSGFNDINKNNQGLSLGASSKNIFFKTESNKEETVDFVKKNAQHPLQKSNDDTDLLKKMLKIGDTNETACNKPTTVNQKNPQENMQKQDESMQLNLQEIFAHAKAHKLVAPKTNSTFHSMRLLSIYQAQGLGCPHYQYFPLPNGKFQAQLRMVNGKIIFGKVADSQELACENVALEVLKIMAPGLKQDSQTRPQTIQPNNFPPPPQQWCQTNASSTEQKSETSDTKQNNFPRSPSKSKTVTNKITKNSMFVPLQAVRHISKSGAKDTTAKEIASQNRNLEKKAECSSKTTQKKEEKSKLLPETNRNKPKRQVRQMRIAANFDFKP